MKKIIVLLALAFSTLAFTQSKERISLHVFDLPPGITIEEFQNDLDRANKIYEKNGFGANKYISKQRYRFNSLIDGSCRN